MAEVYKIIHPVKYFDDIINQKIRPDGRSFFDARNLKITVESIQTAEGSAIVKCGNTTVVCGIQLELATPKAGEPDLGFIITNVELPPLCSSKYRPGPPSDQAQITSQIISDILSNSKCIDLKDLCIVSDKLAWVVYCDIVCLNNDGSLVDACLMSLMASLKTLSFPHVTYNSETEEINVDRNIRSPLKISGLPVATSFSIYTLNGRNNILTDPTAYEEDMCGGIGANLIICYNDDNMLCGIQKFGGKNLTSDCQEKTFKIANKRAKLVKEVIKTCLKKN